MYGECTEGCTGRVHHQDPIKEQKKTLFSVLSKRAAPGRRLLGEKQKSEKRDVSSSFGVTFEQFCKKES